MWKLLVKKYGDFLLHKVMECYKLHLQMLHDLGASQLRTMKVPRRLDLYIVTVLLSFKLRRAYGHLWHSNMKEESKIL